MQGKILCNKLKVRNNEKDMAKSASKLKKKNNEQGDWNLLHIAKNKFKIVNSAAFVFVCKSVHANQFVCVWARRWTYVIVEFWARMWQYIVCESGDVSFSSMLSLLFRSIFAKTPKHCNITYESLSLFFILIRWRSVKKLRKEIELKEEQRTMDSNTNIQ